jgi:hypothetical protein
VHFKDTDGNVVVHHVPELRSVFGAKFSNYYNEIRELTKTQMDLAFSDVENEKLFCVCFTTKDDVLSEKKFNKEVELIRSKFKETVNEAQKNKKGVYKTALEAFDEAIASFPQQITKGYDRVLKGYKVDDRGNGTFLCKDLEIDELRNVNVNTIKWLIYDNVKYIVKS